MRVRKSLNESDQKIFDAVIADQDNWSDYHLAKAMNERGVEISESTIKRHRAGLCTCSRT